MEEIHLQTIQNQTAMLSMRKETVDNRSKLMEFMTHSFCKCINSLGEGCVGSKNTGSTKNSRKTMYGLKSLEGDEFIEFRQ